MGEVRQLLEENQHEEDETELGEQNNRTETVVEEDNDDEEGEEMAWYRSLSPGTLCLLGFPILFSPLLWIPPVKACRTLYVTARAALEARSLGRFDL